ncbi:MAG: DUF2213 domain-containing protein, partial [Gammaproteobacteria bacterium]|nr:DUF2213 domain-containing protein [Gammaproteobacteria bacterium]
HGVTGEKIYFENDTLYGNIKLYSQSMANAVEAGKEDLSLGYACKYKFGVEGIFNDSVYDAIQYDIRGNHLALVDEGRMGKEVSVMDAALSSETFTLDHKRLIPMKNKNESLMTAIELARPLIASVASGAEGTMDSAGISVNSLTEIKEAALLLISGCDESLKEKGVDNKEDDDKKGEDENKDDKKSEGKDSDEDKDDKKEKKGEDDKDDDDDKKDDKKSSGQDAAIAKLTKQVAELTAQATGADSRAIAAIAKRDNLANKLSEFTGAFDHASMTLEQVVKTGMDHFNLHSDEGHAEAVLNGALSVASKNTKVLVSHGADSAIQNKSKATFHALMTGKK